MASCALSTKRTYQDWEPRSLRGIIPLNRLNRYKPVWGWPCTQTVNSLFLPLFVIICSLFCVCVCVNMHDRHTWDLKRWVCCFDTGSREVFVKGVKSRSISGTVQRTFLPKEWSCLTKQKRDARKALISHIALHVCRTVALGRLMVFLSAQLTCVS